MSKESCGKVSLVADVEEGKQVKEDAVKPT